MHFSLFNAQLTAFTLLVGILWTANGIETVHSNGTVKPVASVGAAKHIVSSGRPRNDHDEIKSLINHVVDGLEQKMDVNQAIYLNELSSVADTIIGSFGRSLRDLNARMQTIEMLSHQMDELTDYKNTVDTKLFRLSENTETNQMLNAKLTDLQHTVDYVRTQMDNFIEKSVQQSKRVIAMAPINDVTNGENGLASGEQNAANCESKIDQVISFVHNFAEINRLESSDILNRLSNMQTQLIHFFDADRVNAKSHIHVHSREKVTRNNTLTSNERLNATTETNEMYMTLSPDVMNSTDDAYAKREESDAKPRAARNVLHSYQNRQNDAIDNRQRQSSAKYGLPTHVGCHRMHNSMRGDGSYVFDAIESDRNTAGRNFNERYCSFDISGGGWTVIQRRGHRYQTNGAENFNRTWKDYKNGFGNLNGEFWYGNDFIHRLTYEDDMESKIVLQNWRDQRIEFNYDTFRVDSERNKYNLMIDGFRGENKSLDSMAYHSGQDFSTFDRQNDRTGIDGHRMCCSCASSYASGWWFNNCLEANLNGVYRTLPLDNNFIGIIWEHWLGDYSLKSTQIMIRPKIDWTNDGDDNEMNPNSRPPEDP